MDGFVFLFLNNEKNDHLISILGNFSGKREITFKRRPGFFEAVNLSDREPPPSEKEFPYLFIPIESEMAETFHFHDPYISRNIKFTFHQNSINIIASEECLNTGSISNIFKNFLIKKGNRVLFLVDLPNDFKIPNRF